MITYIKHLPIQGKRLIEIACNSADTKPTVGVATGSVCLEADTGNLYVYDEATTSWVKM